MQPLKHCMKRSILKPLKEIWFSYSRRYSKALIANLLHILYLFHNCALQQAFEQELYPDSWSTGIIKPIHII
jgi:hypothetical protein